jgi:hypothetical protein
VTKKKARSNVAASVLARLLNQARATGDDYQTVLTSYACERFLARLAHSPAKDRFILKGAMLLRTWSDHPYRATRDLDLLRRGEGSSEAIRRELLEICAVVVEDDGLVFDTASITIEPIRAEDEYAGTRVGMDVNCGNVHIPMQIDVGVGDTPFPRPELRDYPTLLGMKEPKVLAYRRETVIAEKFEAAIVLGDRNSRIKDFFDIRYFAETFEFDRKILTEAVRRTLTKRKTQLPPDEPIALREAYWKNPNRIAQVRAFSRRAALEANVDSGREILQVIRPFLLPIIADIREERMTEGVWPPGGPWK